MVRTYMRKKNAPVHDEDEVENIVEKIKKDEWTYKQASEITNISKGTLSSRISRGSSGQIG